MITSGMLRDVLSNDSGDTRRHSYNQLGTGRPAAYQSQVETHVPLRNDKSRKLRRGLNSDDLNWPDLERGTSSGWRQSRELDRSDYTPTPVPLTDGNRPLPFRPPENNDHQSQIQLLERNLASMEKRKAGLLEANRKLTAQLNLKVYESRVRAPPDPANRIVWHDQHTAASIDILIQKLGVLWRTINDAVQAFCQTIVRQQTDFIDARSAKLLYDNAVRIIGEPLAKLIAKDDQRNSSLVNHLFARTVLSVSISNLCALKIECLAPNDPAISEFCAVVYKEILDHEGSVAAGKWRALIQANTKLDMAGWVDDAVFDLVTIMGVAHWDMGDPQQLQTFATKLTPIFELVKAIRVIMREKIISAQIEVSYIPHITQFLDGPMKDALGMPPSPGVVECVIGTAAFGLKQLVEGEREVSGNLVYRNIFPPDVVLESGLRNILEKHNRELSEQNARYSLMCGKD